MMNGMRSATSCRVIESVHLLSRPLVGPIRLLVAESRTFVRNSLDRCRWASAAPPAFDCRGVAVSSQGRRTCARTRGALARLVAGVRRPAAAAPPPYERRELCTELATVAGFLVAAGAAAMALPRAGFSPLTALVLGVLLVVVLAVEFDVAEGRTSPVHLVFVPMLVLVPPAFIPAVVAVAHVARALGSALRGGRPPPSVALAIGGAWVTPRPAD